MKQEQHLLAFDLFSEKTQASTNGRTAPGSRTYAQTTSALTVGSHIAVKAPGPHIASTTKRLNSRVFHAPVVTRVSPRTVSKDFVAIKQTIPVTHEPPIASTISNKEGIATANIVSVVFGTTSGVAVVAILGFFVHLRARARRGIFALIG